ncbi:MAG: leucine-rich repeat protein [Oscillospiraceae bacterium]|jgi:hypothetical protein|nr:leucine-rich repeat protein [Oscillospiraceae bacterium]
MKKLCSLILASLLLIAALAPAAATAAPQWGVVGKYTGGVYTYSLINSGKEVRIEHSAKAKGALTVPDKIAGKPVTQIGEGAFTTCAVTSVKLPASVKIIAAHAFDMCTSLKSVTLPAGLTNIGAYAFFACMALTAVSIPAKATGIGACAFAYCSALSKVTLPEGLSAIPASCFEGCESLKSLALPSSVKTIAALAFAGSGQLASLTLSRNITTIAADAFSQCGKLKSLTINVTIGVGQNYTLPNYAAVKAAAWKVVNSAILKKTSATAYQVVKAGKVTFYVTDSAARKLTVNVTVKPAPTKLVLNKSVTLGVGEKFSTSVTLTPSNAQSTRKYSSSNTKVATVDSAGKITAKAAGKAKITVKSYNGKTAAITVTVKKAPAKVTLNKASLTLAKGKTAVLTASVPSGYASCAQTWTTSNSKIAAVSGGKITAKAKGTCTVTVKTFNGKAATCKITVK